MTFYWHGFDGKDETIDITRAFVVWAEMQPIVVCVDTNGREHTFGLEEGICSIDNKREDK